MSTGRPGRKSWWMLVYALAEGQKGVCTSNTLSSLFQLAPRAASPAESLLSINSHKPPQASRDHSRPAASSSRAANANTNAAGSKRRAPNGRANSPNPDPYNAYELGYNLPSQSLHPSYRNGQSPYDLTNTPLPGSAEWSQLEGPGMPVNRNSNPVYEAPAPPAGDADADTAEADAEGDERKYCFCDGGNFGTMIACDDSTCEREWVRPIFYLSDTWLTYVSIQFHTSCVNLPGPVPDGKWYCPECRTKRAAKRSGRGGRRRNGGRARAG
jgi:inhibitor of growth protein 3